MDYNARFYDSNLGRFISADTLIPQAGDSQSWDRFAFVNNNPLKFIDPTGHGRESTDCGPDGVYCDQDYWNDYDYDPIGLSEPGKDLIELAREIERLTGKRWSFMSITRLIFEREFDGWNSKEYGPLPGIPDLFSEAVGRGYWAWAEARYQTHTKVTMINWLGGHNSVAQSLYTDIFVNLAQGKKSLDAIIGKTRDYHYNGSIASGIAAGLMNPKDEWKVFDPDKPSTFEFCDDSQCLAGSSKKKEALIILPNTGTDSNGNYIFSTDMDDVYFKFGTSFIATPNQIEYWHSP